MKPKVINYKKIPQEIKSYIEQYCEVTSFEDVETQKDEFFEALKDANALIGSGLKVDQELLDQAPNLKVVSNISVGYNNLDINELSNRSIIATNTPDVLTDTTADTVFGILLATARRMTELDQLVKGREWNEIIGTNLFGVDVHHKTLGIIGMGRIGQAIAKRAHLGFDMKILYHNRSRNEKAETEYNATYCELDYLLKQSDFVCLMTPLTPETERLIGKREFSLMKKSAIFVNGSRGETIVEQDLIEALQTGTILAAGLDVFEQEPVNKDNPLLDMKNVVTLPHIGSATYETRFNMAKLAAENLVKALTGETPPNQIN